MTDKWKLMELGGTLSQYNKYVNEIDMSYIKQDYIKHLKVELEDGECVILKKDEVLTDISKVTVRPTSEENYSEFWQQVISARAFIDVNAVMEDASTSFMKFLKTVYSDLD